MAKGTPKGSFFKNLEDEKSDFDPEKFLTEVESAFGSETITKEVRWRLSVLKEVSAQPEFSDVGQGLRDRLTQIFSAETDEQSILGNLKKLTEIQRSDGAAVELRRFLKRERRTLNEFEYRNILTKKTKNTRDQMRNLIAFFPEAANVLGELSKETDGLIKKIGNTQISIKAVRELEGKIRDSPPFVTYEELKLKFLREWLSQFTSLTTEQIEGMSQDDIQQMVVEHQRHQMTQLLKTKISVSDSDMTEHLGLHDTLECGYTNTDFWTGANTNARTGFRKWILAVIQTFGMLKGQRYVFFKSQEAEEQFLLFGVGVAELPGSDDVGIEMVPYIKPFTRKAGYLLEIRKREMADPDQYHYELRHYMLPFLFAFDQMPNFKVNKELIAFFTTNY